MRSPSLYSPGLSAESMLSAMSGQSHGEVPSHDLEAHIDVLRKINKIRKISADMRTSGHKGLLRLYGGDIKKTGLYEQYKLARVAWRFLTKDNSSEEINEQRERIERLRQNFLLYSINSDAVPVLTAAEAMRTFVGVGYLSFSEETILSWYVVIREIFTATKPDWCIGGARAGHSGWVTAYSTSQCVRALCDLAEVMKRTGEFLHRMQNILDHIVAISDEHIPPAWRDVDNMRMTEDVLITLSLASNKVVFNLDDVGREKFDVNTFLEKNLKSIVAHTMETFIREFPHVRGELRSSMENGDASTGHAYAMDTIEAAFSLAIEAVSDLKKERWMELIAQRFLQVEKSIRTSMSASKGFLSSVIDRQLAVSGSTDCRSWEPSELAYAVSAYALALNDENDTTEKGRFQLAATLLYNDLSADGTLTNRVPFHTTPDGLQYIVHTEELLGALAEVFRAAHSPVDERLATSMIHYFTRQCRQQSDGTIKWFFEFDHQLEYTSIIASVDAVESLGAFNRMLDEGINEIILDHFSVRIPKPSGTGLNDLFYPDYGFSRAKSKLIRRKSIALTMQDMRAHVLGVNERTLCSLVLYGPGGTGKTMLVEALANTCDVKLVEVTPSDIAKGGEAAIEKRARAVFEALSMLSHVVILFDEFDPVLKRRDKTGKVSTNFFSFLTPGMLPKLKALHDSAKDRKVSYALITNLIRTLDIPAIRKGRFDKAVGIYPPDPLSRAGYFSKLCCKHAKDRKWGSAFDLSRFMKVMAKTGGLGMTSLTEKGNFSAKDKSNLEKRPIGYVFKKCKKISKIGEREEKFDEKVTPDMDGQFAEQEFLDWGCLVEWDKRLDSARTRAVIKKGGKPLLKYWGKILGWLESDQALKKAERFKTKLKSS